MTANRSVFKLGRLVAVAALLALGWAAWEWENGRMEQAQTERLNVAREVYAACRKHAEAHEGKFPDSLRELARGGLVSEAFYESMMKLGTWDYLGLNHTTKEENFLLASLHVLPAQSVEAREVWVGLWSREGVEEVATGGLLGQ